MLYIYVFSVNVYTVTHTLMACMDNGNYVQYTEIRIIYMPMLMLKLQLILTM